MTFALPRRALRRLYLCTLAALFLSAAPGTAQVAPNPSPPAATPKQVDVKNSDAAKPDAKWEAALERERKRVAASQNYDPKPAIWKIGDADTTIYLFGTVHALPPGFRWRNPWLDDVIRRADTLWLESTGADDEDAANLTHTDGNGQKLRPLLDRSTHRIRAQLAQMQNDLPPDVVKSLDEMPTWLAAMTLGSLRDMKAGEILDQGADDWLEKQFRATGRPVAAIEDAKAVTASLDAIPEAAQRMMLEAAILSPERNHEEMDSGAHAWAKGDVGPDSILRIRPEDLDPAGLMAAPLLDDRNRAWVVKLRERLSKPGTLLFAAGAGHFVGPGSVIDLLEKQGVRVVRVQ